MAKKESKQPKKVQRAAKKPVKKVAKKVSRRKTASKPAPKKAIKKVAKKPKKKSVPKRAVTQKLPKKSETKAERDSREVALEHLFKKSEPEVTKEPLTAKLPTHMSIRAVEKAKAIKEIFSDRTAMRVGLIAYALSFAFILIGGLHTAGYILVDSTEGRMQLGNVLSGTTITDTQSQITNQAVVIEPSQLEVATPVPKILEDEFRMSFFVSNADSVVAVLRNSDTGMRFQLPTETIGPEDFALLIPSGLAPGRYSVQIVVVGKDGADYDFKAGSFAVEQMFAANSGDDDIQSNVDDIVTDNNLTDDDQIVAPVVPTSTAPVRNEFSLFLSTTTLSVPQMLIMQAPRDISELTVYLVKRNSFSKQLLGTADRELNTWRLFIDVTHIPNGQYDLFAEGTIDGFSIESRRQTIDIRKPVISAQILDQENETEEIEVSDDESTTPKRNFSELSLTPERSTDPEAEAIVTELLRDNKSDLEILLRNYSVAAQTEDVIAKRLATDAINRKQAELQEAGQLPTPAIKDELSERLLSLQDRIDTFEELRRSRSDNETALDSDSDGVSDVDETTLFRTDPDNPDTDGDGVVDGVEIMRGYNPRVATSETSILYESPRTTAGLEQPETLRINNVSPAIQTTADEKVKKVQATITGHGLPNSYLTLYVFSVPTIVTVRTDDTGAFSYTFAKELEDGTHEVFVAITDNAGEIVAQSEGFTFTKRAEAFTVGAAPISETPTQTSVPETPYALGLGLGVLALGIILLMLGIGLRRPTPQLAS